MTSAVLKQYEDFPVGTRCEKDYAVTRSVYDDFLRLFGDGSPLHVSDDYAKACGFEGILMHGAILNGFVSNFIGMVFPGGRSLELSVDIRFLQPVYLEDRLRLEGEISQKLEAHSVLVVNIRFQNLTRGTTAANGRVQVKMMTA